MTTTTDQAAEVAAWNAAHRPGTLIQWRRTPAAAWTTSTTWTDAYLLKGVPTLRPSSGEFAPLANVRVHPLTDRLAELDRVEVADLDFPPPDCEFCHVATSHDGDRFYCPQCRARWTSNGTDGSRCCVECGVHEAEVLGGDQQPRCLPCAAEVLAGTLDPTAPYECRRCGGEVVGIGREHGQPWAKRLCGLCSDAADRDADLNRWRTLRAGAGAR
ncbi:hypothetical protein Drose_05795 [Dactylosporangium roseum]|uniref:Uncharacterized protein n=1 Tax=Dactylosporangium roseum TaxID=47989 RepID=A0ABY5Z9W2_9ACTN|nr:hypothetical protein [Dactylosporangium roseum]UWZ37783.1 hypothetical protein Drose_05795 [Dactylosporangium roseum]